MAVTFAPPLPAAKTMAGESDPTAVALRSTEIFERVLVGRDLHRRAAVRADAKDVCSSVVATVGTEVNPATIVGPCVKLIVAVIKRQTLQVAGIDRQDVDIAVACTRGTEGQLFAVR